MPLSPLFYCFLHLGDSRFDLWLQPLQAILAEAAVTGGLLACPLRAPRCDDEWGVPAVWDEFVWGQYLTDSECLCPVSTGTVVVSGPPRPALSVRLLHYWRALLPL